MKIFNILFVIALSMVIGFGCWYLIIWFITNQSNLFFWPWYVKIFFLIFGSGMSNSLIDRVNKSE